MDNLDIQVFYQLVYVLDDGPNNLPINENKKKPRLKIIFEDYMTYFNTRYK